MSKRFVFLMCAAFCVVSATATLSDEKSTTTEKPAATPAQSPSAQPATSQPATAAPAKPVSLGKAEDAKWTATTMEAATNEAQKKMLENGKAATITGEVVDVSCYMQLGKRGEAHVACGSKCIAAGQPIGILDADDNLYIVMPEEHHPRRDGQADIRNVFAPLLAKTVTVHGMATEMKSYRALFVNAADLGALAKPAGAGAK